MTVPEENLFQERQQKVLKTQETLSEMKIETVQEQQEGQAHATRFHRLVGPAEKMVRVTEEELKLYRATQLNVSRKPVFRGKKKTPEQLERLGRCRKKLYSKKREKYKAAKQVYRHETAREQAFFQLVSRRRESEAAEDMRVRAYQEIHAQHPEYIGLDLDIAVMNAFADGRAFAYLKEVDANEKLLEKETEAFCEMMRHVPKQKLKKSTDPENREANMADAIRYYCGDNYEEVNWPLRHPGRYMPLPHSMEEYEKADSSTINGYNRVNLQHLTAMTVAPDMAKLGKKAMDHMTLTRTTIVRKGAKQDVVQDMLGLTEENFEEGMQALMRDPGQRVLRDKGFFSTAHSQEGSGFLNQYFSGRVQLIIEAKKGTHAINISNSALEVHSGEHELLLAPGTPMKLLRVRRAFDKGWRLYLSTIPEQEQGA